MKKLLNWFKDLSALNKTSVTIGVLLALISSLVASLILFAVLVSPPEELIKVEEVVEEVETEEIKEETAVEQVVEETGVEEPAEVSEPEAVTLKTGDTGQGENWDYTVNSFEVKDKLFGKYGGVAEAGEGQQFLIVNVTFKNITKETKGVSGFNFKAYASGDLTFDECFGFDLSVILDKGYTAFEDVAPGGSVTGDIVFKISAGATDLEFEVGYDDLIWDLQ